LTYPAALRTSLHRANKGCPLSYLSFPDISPVLYRVELFGYGFELRWYALAYIAGILIAYRIVLMALRRARFWAPGVAPMSSEQTERLLTWIIFGIILGGRLGYVVFYKPAYFFTHPWEIPVVWQGGMSFHGGFLGVILAAVWFCRREGIAMRPLGDLLAIAAPPGLFLGRVANFINAELWGRSTDLPWGVAFPGEAAQACAGVAGICARHPSQLYEAILEGLVLGAVLLWLAWRRGWLSRPGALMGVFLAGYGLARFAVEFVRQPDANFVTADNPVGLAFHIGGYGLTMGQALSLPMIAVGLWFIRRARPA
jgi:phosphatidylglycerol---prolipoprotein diacylglyceryl transferase